MKDVSNKAFIRTGLLLAISSSLCCIMPILAVLGGIGGIASCLSWINPLRPYLIALSIIVLVIAFYQAYKPIPADECRCTPDNKRSFINSKKFLWIITGLSVFMFCFPYYSGIFFSKQSSINTIDIGKNNIEQVHVNIEGMTCEGCQEHINSELSKVKGVLEYKTSYANGNSNISYDTDITTIDSIVRVINSTGYTVKGIQLIKPNKSSIKDI